MVLCAQSSADKACPEILSTMPFYLMPSAPSASQSFSIALKMCALPALP
jgi:hypothetical protein